MYVHMSGTFKYFWYISDKRRYQWTLDHIGEEMLAIMTGPHRMRNYDYDLFVKGNFTITWQKLEREKYLTCTAT